MSVTINGTSGVTLPAGAGLTGVGSDSLTSFLANDVALNNTGSAFDGPNTGSIGASGQKWEITFIASIWDDAGAAIVQAAIWDGSAYIAAEAGYVTGTQGIVLVMKKVVTLTGATTFTGRAKSNATTSKLKTTGNATLGSNMSTSITAVRLS